MGLQALGQRNQANQANKNNEAQIAVTREAQAENNRRFNLGQEQQTPFRQQLVNRLNKSMEAPSMSGQFAGSGDNPYSMESRGQQYTGPAAVEGTQMAAVKDFAAPVAAPTARPAKRGMGRFMPALLGAGLGIGSALFGRNKMTQRLNQDAVLRPTSNLG